MNDEIKEKALYSFVKKFIKDNQITTEDGENAHDVDVSTIDEFSNKCFQIVGFFKHPKK